MIQFPGQHSAHVPAGPQAVLLDHLGDLLYGIAAVVFVLVVVFALGMFGASLAVARNGGHVPPAAEPSVQLAKSMAPL